MIHKVPPSWLAVLGEEFTQPYFMALEQFVDTQRRDTPEAIFPREDEVFAAFQATPFNEVRVLLLGQDPYPGKGMAHGLCFSVDPSVRKLPASLRNIFKELRADLGVPLPDNGCLLPWARQGVLMLNTILTVREGQPLSHQQQGWERFTDQVIRQVSAQGDRVIFVLWGKSAQSKASLVDASRHAIVAAAHPSPLSARKFFGSRPFSTINALLTEDGGPEIDWRLPRLSVAD